MKRTAAVIVTYNRKAMLQRCLRALCTQTAGVPELWVIDNASTDGTAELVAQLNLPTMHYYNTGKNLGGAGGFACGIHLPLVLGFTVIIIPNLDPAKLGSLVLKHKPEHMFGVPTHYQQLAADPKVQKKDLSFIHNYAAGGDAISLGAEKTVNEFLASHNVEYPMAKGYGMTEVASAATVAAGKNNKPGSVGIPMVNTVVAVCLIGLTTFTISCVGIKAGSVFGARYKSKAEFVGGAILILIGVKILLEHLGVL